MAPFPEFDAKPAVHHLARRDLSVNNSQAVTLGIIAVYVVVIALLWNIPYVRNVLWPFKVRLCTCLDRSTIRLTVSSDAHDRFP